MITVSQVTKGFGGRTLFEVRVGDSAQVGRYRRLR